MEGSGAGAGLTVKQCNSSTENAKPWRSESFTSSHGYPSSDNSQLSVGSTSRPAHLSGQSLEMSGESGNSGGLHDAQQRTPPQAPRVPHPTASSKAGARGYRARREQLHKAKSKTTISESDVSLSELQQSWGEGEQQAVHSTEPPPRALVDATPPPQHTIAAGRVVPSMHSSAVIPIVRHRSVKEKGSDSPHIQSGKTRPLSAIDPHSVNIPPSSSSPYTSAHLAPSAVPLFHTITTLTPSGEREEFREVDIGEAINRSQGGVLSAQEHRVDTVGMLRKPFARHVSIY